MLKGVEFPQVATNVSPTFAGVGCPEHVVAVDDISDPPSVIERAPREGNAAAADSYSARCPPELVAVAFLVCE